MSRKKKLTELQCTVIETLIAISGYKNARIAELLQPFMGADDVTIDLDTLHKRICRIQPDNYLGSKSTLIPGTYAVHGIRVHYGDKRDTLLIIVELNTGWIYAKLLPKVKTQDIIISLYDIFDQLKLDSVKMPYHELVLMSYKQEYINRNGSAGKSAVAYATIMKKQPNQLAANIKRSLRSDYHKKIDIRFQIIEDKTVLQPVQLAENWNDKDKLISKIQELLDDYNYSKRVKFSRTKKIVSPYLNLRKTLTEVAKKSKKKLPTPSKEKCK